MKTKTDWQRRKELSSNEIKLREIGKLIGPIFKDSGWGFALVIFSFGEAGYSSYISNAERHDMIKVLRECADTLEEKRDLPQGVIGNMQ